MHKALHSTFDETETECETDIEAMVVVTDGYETDISNSRQDQIISGLTFLQSCRNQTSLNKSICKHGLSKSRK